MRGVVFTGNRHLEVRDFDVPQAGPGQAVIRIQASGMCGSDLHFYRAESPEKQLISQGFGSFADRGLPADTQIIAGHEPCGVIEEVGPGVPADQFKPGDRVMVFHYEGCGYCDHCRTGWTQMCDEGAEPHGAIKNGGHADFMCVPASTLVHLPEEISFVGGAAISCGTGTAFGAICRLDLSARDTFAVFGLGPVGLSAVQLAAAMGVEVFAVDIDEARVAAAMNFGASHAINGRTHAPVEEILKLTGGKGVSASVDCAGGEIAKTQAVQATAPWGRIALVAVGGNLNVVGWNDLIKSQRTVIGSYTFSIGGMKDCAQFIAKNGVDVDKIFSNKWSIEQAAEAYDAFDKQAGGKGVFVF